MNSATQVLVSGATGFIGRHVVSQLVKRKIAVKALVRNAQAAAEMAQLQGASLLPCEVTDKHVHLTIDRGASLIHCAWPDVRDTGNLLHLEAHFTHALNFLKSAIEQGVRKVIVLGSCYEYGAHHGPAYVDSHKDPQTPYGMAKLALHKALQIHQKHIDFELTWARLFYLWGDGQDQNTVLGSLLRSANKGDPIFNMSFGEQLMDYLPVEEAAHQLIELLHHQSGEYNICSGHPISLRRFIEDQIQSRNIQIKINLGHFPYRKNESMALWGGDPFKKSAAP